ncbi:MAG TPA: hypothetical protein VHN79_06745, partial [Lacunisphaera sp.]|nr:hypothetical protein [Lacunisphaera sp.]
MKTTLCSMLFAGLLAGGSSGLAASPEAGPEAGTERVTVIFEHPEKFTDLKDNVGDSENERGRER